MKKTQRETKQRKPLIERMQKAAAAGDPQAVVDAYEGETIDPQIYWPDYQQLLQQALEKAADADPAGTVRFALNRLLAFQTTLTLRAQHLVSRELDRFDRSAPQNDGNLPDHIASEWLPRLDRLQAELKDTCQVYSKNWHVLELAEARARKSGKVIPFMGGRADRQAGTEDDAAAAQS